MGEDVFLKRLDELARRAAYRGEAVYTPFLDLAQQSAASAAARAVGVPWESFGGYPEAERRVVAFRPDGEALEWPITAVRIAWRAQFGSPRHRDILGALMALGFDRACVGDIVMDEGQAWLMAGRDMAGYIASSLTSCGRITVRCEAVDDLPDMPPPAGRSVRDTVPSLRLDAVTAAAYSLSRAEAARLIAQGRVFIDQVQTLSTDAPVPEGGLVSVRGQGRFRLTAVEGETRKGRLAVRLFIYGEV